MRASELIGILARHIADREGGDFEVHVWTRAVEHPIAPPHNMALDSQPVARCWLYPGLSRIIVGAAAQPLTLLG